MLTDESLAVPGILVAREMGQVTCWHVGESGGCDDCKLGLEPMSCDEEFAAWYRQCEG